MFSGDSELAHDEGRVEWAITWPEDQNGFCYSYCNTVVTPQGGTHELGFKNALLKVLKEYAEKRYGKEGASKRIIATTDAKKGALKTLSTENKYRTFVIPDDVGGRYSVLTPVGLIPIAAAGINIEELIKGFDSMAKLTKDGDYKKNPSMLYAMIRNILYNKGFSTEIAKAKTKKEYILLLWIFQPICIL